MVAPSSRHWPWTRLLGTAALVTLVVAVFAWVNAGRVTGQEPFEKLTTVLADLARAVPQDRGAAPAAQAERAPLAVDTLPQSVQDAVRGHLLRFTGARTVQVYVLMREVNDANLGALKNAGAAVEITDAPRRRVQASVPVSRLQAVAALPFVTFVRLPSYAVHRRVGGVTSEGDAILHADAARSQYALDGSGVKVGVISDGLKGVFATGCTTCGGVSGGPISTGDLPSASGTRGLLGTLTSSSGGIVGKSFQANSDLEGLQTGCAFAGAGAEGTALLEIVHDVAPNAQLAFANADTDLAFNQAVNYLASTNDIVLDDIGFYGVGENGASSISTNTAAALNNNSNPIRAYVTSVGNAADEHYYGAYTDSGVGGSSFSPGIANGGRLHLFQQSSDTTDLLGLGPQPYNAIQLPTNGEVVIFLTWDEPFGAAGNNYDLYLVKKSNNAVVARSTDLQSGSQDPVEAIDYTNTGAADQFRIVVLNVNSGAAAKNLNLFSFQPECAQAGPGRLVPDRNERHNFNTATRSVAAQGDAGGSPVSVISVAAICSATAGSVTATSNLDASCLDRTNSTVEFFSSQGPTLDGRLKPEIAAIDGVSITAAGRFVNPFFGTSAASPHVGAIAALVLQAAPCLASGGTGALDPAAARTRLRDVLLRNATPLGDTVPNNATGYGRANAVASVQQALPVLTGPGSLTVSGNNPLGATLSPSQLGFSDPNGCQVTKLSWSGGCGTSPGTTLNCGFGTTTVGVGASSNGTSFSPPSDLQITVTNFGLGISPGSATVTAGQPATFQVAVTAQGGAFGSPIALGCSNLPTGAGCSFSPSSVTPGSGTTLAKLTISTTVRAGAAGGSRVPGAAALLGDGTPVLPARSVAATSSAAALLVVFLLAASTVLLPIVRRPGPARWRTVGLASVVAALVAGLATAQLACNSGSGPTPTPTPTSTTTPTPSPTTLSLSPASLTFASQAVQTPSAPQSITLRNSGSTALTISGIGANGDFSATNTCGGTVPAGGSCSIGVTFTPTATGGRTGTLTVTSNASGSPHTVALTGTGQSASGGTPAGSYAVSVTGTSGTLVQAGTATLVVQ